MVVSLNWPPKVKTKRSQNGTTKLLVLLSTLNHSILIYDQTSDYVYYLFEVSADYKFNLFETFATKIFLLVLRNLVCICPPGDEVLMTTS